MIKHVGKIGDRRVAIVFREVPGEEHMALVIYPDIMPAHIHDSVMKVLESPIGQSAENLGEAMFRSLLPDGRQMLATLHTEGMIKKVQAKQVIVTPTATSHVNLEELNKIINEMKKGDEAVKRLAELDAQQGMTGKVRPRDDFGRELGAPLDNRNSADLAGSNATAGALDDAALAKNFAEQAARMEAEAKSLLAESARLLAEAKKLSTVTDSAPIVTLSEENLAQQLAQEQPVENTSDTAKPKKATRTKKVAAPNEA